MQLGLLKSIYQQQIHKLNQGYSQSVTDVLNDLDIQRSELLRQRLLYMFHLTFSFQVPLQPKMKQDVLFQVKKVLVIQLFLFQQEFDIWKILEVK